MHPARETREREPCSPSHRFRMPTAHGRPMQLAMRSRPPARLTPGSLAPAMTDRCGSRAGTAWSTAAGPAAETASRAEAGIASMPTTAPRASSSRIARSSPGWTGAPRAMSAPASPSTRTTPRRRGTAGGMSGPWRRLPRMRRECGWSCSSDGAPVAPSGGTRSCSPRQRLPRPVS